MRQRSNARNSQPKVIAISIARKNNLSLLVWQLGLAGLAYLAVVSFIH